VDAHLGEERIETVHFLAFFHKGVVLGHAEEGKFFHEVDLMRFSHMLFL